MSAFEDMAMKIARARYLDGTVDVDEFEQDVEQILKGHPPKGYTNLDIQYRIGITERHREMGRRLVEVRP